MCLKIDDLLLQAHPPGVNKLHVGESMMDN